MSRGLPLFGGWTIVDCVVIVYADVDRPIGEPESSLDIICLQQDLIMDNILGASTDAGTMEAGIVASKTHQAPVQGQWLRPDGHKLNKLEWHANGVYIDAIDHGATWQFHTEPPPASRPNHPSAVMHAEKCAVELQQLEHLGLVEYKPPNLPVTGVVSHVHPFGVVVKGDQASPKIRMVVDQTITRVNAHMTHLPLSLPSCKEALALTTSSSVLGKRDLRFGFHHVMLQSQARRYMGFEHPAIPRRIGRWVALPFGASQSPAIFCNITSEAAGVFNRKFSEAGVAARCLVYVDDFFVAADDHHQLRLAFAIMDSVGAKLGLEWNDEKDVG